MRHTKQQQGRCKRQEQPPQAADARAPVVLDTGMQRHVVNYAYVRERQQHLRSAAGQLAVAQNVAVHAAAGEQPVGVNDAVDVVDDVDVDAEAHVMGERREDDEG